MVTLEGKAIAITGAGRGLGRAYALASAAVGAAILVNDIDPEPAEAVVAEITAAGGRAVAHPGDISSSYVAAAVVDRCVEEFGAIDGLVNNAGFGMIDASAPDAEPEEHFRRVFEVNVFGTAACATQAMRHMVPRGQGSIINIASGAMCGTQQLGSYSASKAAAATLALSWAVDLANTGVRVNAVAPMSITRHWNWDLIPDRTVLPPAERLAPECNAGLIVYLLSDQAAPVHGQVVSIRGGKLALITHPAVVEPVLDRTFWSADDVAQAFAEQLSARQLPLGMAQIRLELAV